MELIKKVTVREYKGFYTITDDDILREFRIELTGGAVETFKITIVDGVVGVDTSYIKDVILDIIDNFENLEDVCGLYLGTLGD